MVDFAIVLVLAHIVGDFILQPKHWVENKMKNKLTSKYLYFHIVVHALLLLFAFQFKLQYWLGFVFIVLTHLIIDIVKVTSQTNSNKRVLFFLDQLAHFIVLLLVVLFYKGKGIEITSIFNSQIQLLLLVVFLETKVTSICIDVIFTRWEIMAKEEKSLENAGKYIGILERLLILFFVIIGHWEGVGFLLAAKSIFRFSDLTRAEDRKLTEYILIGTLLSFGFAMLIAQFYVSVKSML